MTMDEIQIAAGIITESIDPEAKVKFGTVKDTKLKKNEIKITVIATGFGSPDGNQENTQEAQPERNRIQNSMPTRRPEVKKPAPLPPVDDDDDSWDAIPSFLRRK